MTKIVKVWADDCYNDPPGGDDDFKVVSFSTRHRSHEPPSRYFADNGRPTLALASKLRAGTAFVLDYYEHGLCRWSLSGSGPQCQWDTARGAGLLLWQNKPKHIGKTYEEREKQARSFLETYTDWCNGSIYGYTIEERKLMPCGHTETETLDSCGGFYGSDLKYMAEEIRSALDGETDIELHDESGGIHKSDLLPKIEEART